MQTTRLIQIVGIFILLLALSTPGIAQSPSTNSPDGPDDPDVPTGEGVFPEAIPQPLPEWQPPLNVTVENNLVSYDLASGKEEILPMPEVDPDLPAQFAYWGDSQAAGRGEALAPQNFSELEQIPDPSLYPWRVNVKLWTTWPSGLVTAGSGVLVDQKHVLTAGHVVFAFNSFPGNHPCLPITDENASCWASSIRVAPGYQNDSAPYGEANAVSVYSWTPWIQNKDWDWDMGYFSLDRPVGALTGVFAFGYNNTDSFFTDNTFHNPGYPGESPYDGETMWYWYGSFDDVYTHVLQFDRTNYGGQSGSGVYYKDVSDNRIVYAVVSSKYGVATRDTRITSEKFTSLRDRILANTPATPDLVPLDVNVPFGSIPAGNALTSLDYLIHNYSSAAYNGTVTVKVYLSTNDNISTSDTLIQTHTVNLNLGARSNVRVNISNPPVIPQPTSGGTYYIGIILDISDADTNNNDTDGWDADRVQIIQCDKPSIPALQAPADGGAINDATPLFNWSDASPASRYQIMVDNNGDWSSPEINTYAPTSQHTPGSSLADNLYYWAVRPHNQNNGCNVYGDWSGAYDFLLDTVDPHNPTSLDSSSHNPSEWSSDNTVTAYWAGAWDDSSGVFGYHVSWDQSPTSYPPGTTTAFGSSTTSNPLADGNNWYFHLTTVDNARNETNQAIHLGPFYIDATAPSSGMTALAGPVCPTAFTVRWSGSDPSPGSGGVSYDVQYRIGGGSWVTWLNRTTSTSRLFGAGSPVTLVEGQTYDFRVRAWDAAGNVEAYPASPDASILISYCGYLPLTRR